MISLKLGRLRVEFTNSNTIYLIMIYLALMTPSVAVNFLAWTFITTARMPSLYTISLPFPRSNGPKLRVAPFLPIAPRGERASDSISGDADFEKRSWTTVHGIDSCLVIAILSQDSTLGSTLGDIDEASRRPPNPPGPIPTLVSARM